MDPSLGLPAEKRDKIAWIALDENLTLHGEDVEIDGCVFPSLAITSPING